MTENEVHSIYQIYVAKASDLTHSYPKDVVLGYARGDPEDIRFYYGSKTRGSSWLGPVSVETLKIVDVTPGKVQEIKDLEQKVKAAERTLKDI